MAIDGLYREGIDKFNVCTITNSKKELPFNFRPEYIEEKYMAKIYAMANTGSSTFIKREIAEGKNTKETLYDVAKELKSSIIVCGQHGRKGPKE